jgi:UDP-N-acetylglucosamine acyltransferase
VGAGVEIGPFAVIEERVVIGEGCQIAARASIKRGTILGKNNVLHEGAVLGGRPQHLGAPAEVGRLVIGDHNHFREHVTVHVGLTSTDVTTIGNHCLLMINVHIAHDCHLGNNVIMANNSMLAGHVSVGDRAYISGAVGVHQFCRVGAYAMVGGQSHVHQDVPPFVTVDGQTTTVVGLNKVGLRRAGMTREEIDRLKQAYRFIYRSGLPFAEMLAQLAVSIP